MISKIINLLTSPQFEILRYLCINQKREILFLFRILLLSDFLRFSTTEQIQKRNKEKNKIFDHRLDLILSNKFLRLIKQCLKTMILSENVDVLFDFYHFIESQSNFLIQYLG